MDDTACVHWKLPSMRKFSNMGDDHDVSGKSAEVVMVSIQPPQALADRFGWSLARILFVFGMAGVAGCCLVAQPTLRSNQASSRTADPDRPRGHVEMLSEVFHPRDWTHPGNPNRSAEYIAGQFRQ